MRPDGAMKTDDEWIKVCVRPLADVITLSYWERHLTLTVALSTNVYKYTYSMSLHTCVIRADILRVSKYFPSPEATSNEVLCHFFTIGDCSF